MKIKSAVKILLLSIFYIACYFNATAQQKGDPPSEMTGSISDLHKRINGPLSELTRELTTKDTTLNFSDSSKVSGKPLIIGKGSNGYRIEIVGTENNIAQVKSIITIPYTLEEAKIELNRPALVALIATGKLGIDWYYQQLLLLLKNQNASFNSSTVIYSLTKINLNYDSTNRKLLLNITSL